MSTQATERRPFLPVANAAVLLDVSEDTVREWLKAGRLPSYKLGGVRRIDPADVEALAERRRVAEEPLMMGVEPRIPTSPTNVVDLGWERQRPEREAARRRYWDLLKREPGPWVTDVVLARRLGLGLPQLRFLMHAGMPHIRISRAYRSKPCAVDAWMHEFAPSFLPLPRKRRAISVAVRREVYARDHHRCRHCGSSRDLSIDHIFPWSLGGPDVAENFQTLCRSCNSRKAAKVK